MLVYYLRYSYSLNSKQTPKNKTAIVEIIRTSSSFFMNGDGGKKCNYLTFAKSLFFGLF